MEVVHSAGRRGEGSCVGGGDVFSQAAAESRVSSPAQHGQWTRLPVARFSGTLSHASGEHISTRHRCMTSLSVLCLNVQIFFV